MKCSLERVESQIKTSHLLAYGKMMQVCGLL